MTDPTLPGALRTRERLELLEEGLLAPWAERSAASRGREAPERPARLRTEFQRDRDRILHCAAFRKLEYKTQVYVTHEGDFFRTRLTHTLEVAQIARTIGRALGLNNDLVEAIALAHDLGHTPFGHTGEAVLDELLADGFEHNAQSLRVVEVLEERFHDRPGLNLSWEVREGIAHHSKACSPAVRRYFNGGQPSLEAQVVDLADEIAYNHHDLDDALGMGLLTAELLGELDWLAAIWHEERERLPAGSTFSHVRNRFLGALMDRMVDDAVGEIARAIEEQAIDSPVAVRAAGGRLVRFSPPMDACQRQLRDFLMARVYRHPTTLRMQHKAAGFFRRLFELYRGHPELLPLVFQGRLERDGLERVLTDFLSGMTDRACLQQYRELFEPDA